jgi:hypothetical protein
MRNKCIHTQKLVQCCITAHVNENIIHRIQSIKYWYTFSGNGNLLHLETLGMFFLVYTRYIPGIYQPYYQVYTFIIPKPGISLLYTRNMFSEKIYILIMLNEYMHLVSTF